MSEEKLKPCPFCGEKEAWKCKDSGLEIRGDASDHRAGIFERSYWVVDCHTCGASGPIRMSQRLCIKSWNKRVT